MPLDQDQQREVNTDKARGIVKLTNFTSVPVSAKRIIGDIDCAKMRTLAVGAKVTYHASATKGAKINVYHSPTGARADLDTVPYASFTIDFTAGSTIKKTKNYDIPEDGSLSIEIENLDAAQTITDIECWTMIRRWIGV